MAEQIIDANQDVQQSTLVDPAYRASAGAVVQDAGRKSRAAVAILPDSSAQKATCSLRR